MFLIAKMMYENPPKHITIGSMNIHSKKVSHSIFYYMSFSAFCSSVIFYIICFSFIFNYHFSIILHFSYFCKLLVRILNILERDFKPANIIYVEKDKSFWLLDFSEEKVLTENKLHDDKATGTPEFMTPEKNE